YHERRGCSLTISTSADFASISNCLLVVVLINISINRYDKYGWTLLGRAQDSLTNEGQEYFRRRGLLCDLPSSLGLFESAITGTRPSVLLPQNTYLPDNSSLSKRKRTYTFKSDLPKYILLKDLPDLVCYRDIELFYLKDP
ncbi:hypothetical protein N7462_001818, partial [Penicillium macrosclerotiorum]|uniref:uncharacterized protein n=1 Tax=Penicillium macrosclerotiorum TaxID=303699 RepID=UPI002548BB86